MKDEPCMRWSPGGRQSWRRRRDGGFDSSLYEVREIWPRQASPFVTSVHYLHSMPSVRRCYGLFEIATQELVGVAILSTPVNKKTIPMVFPELDPIQAAELGRYVLLDRVPANAESWFLAEVRYLAARPAVLLDPRKKEDPEYLRKKVPLLGLMMFADPVPRMNLETGQVIKPGHWGTAYQASGCKYLGTSGKSIEAVFRDGTVFNRRTMQKIRAQEQGHGYAERMLLGRGARPMRPGENPARWMREALDDVGAVKVENPGKFKYGIALGVTRADRQAVLIANARDHTAYPKKDRGQLELALSGPGAVDWEAV